MKDFLNSSKLLKITLIYVPIFLFILVVAFFSLNLYLLESKNKKEVVASPIKVEVAEIPALKSVYEPSISAKGAIIIDADTKTILYSKNPNLRLSSASTAKIMSALVGIEHYDLDQVLTVKTSTSEGAIIGLTEGEKITFKNLLNALLIPSANDAALCLAQNYLGGEEEFVKKMNDKAREWKLYNTSFQDPAGLNDSTFTTPFEIARLASIAVKNNVISEIVGQKYMTVVNMDGKEYKVESTNKILGINGIDGIKTGFTEEAGEVLVASKYEPLYGQNRRKLIYVVMGSKNRFEDMLKLTDLTTNNITLQSIDL